MSGRRLENKVALITGAGSGFGEAMAKRFVAEGAKVAVVDLRGDQSIGNEWLAFKAEMHVSAEGGWMYNFSWHMAKTETK